MSGRLVYPWSEALLQYRFRHDHPLDPDRLRLTYVLSDMVGLLDESVEVVEPPAATREELGLFHSAEFIDAVRACDGPDYYDRRHGIGTPDNPAFREIYEAATRYVGATLEAAKRMVQGTRMAFCISGGLHHAQRSEASGFCVFNDVVIAINYIQQERPCKVLYFDFDAHHGDGVQNAFYRTPDVLTVSVHQSGRTLFPGTGHVFEYGAGEGTGYSVNVPLSPGAGDAELIRVFNEVVIPLSKSYRPDLLVTQLGVDGHFLDPLAQLAYTSTGYEHVLRGLVELAKTCEMGWLALGGGGYHPVNVARLWTLFLALMLARDVPRDLPEEFVAMCREDGYRSFPTTFRDTGQVPQMYVSAGTVAAALDRTLARLHKEVFPYHGLA